MESEMKTLIEEDPFAALLYNTLALEWWKPAQVSADKPYIKNSGHTTCCFFTGRLLRPNQDAIDSVHFAQTGPFAVLVDAETDDILHDFLLPDDIIMVVEAKQAFIIRNEQSFIMLHTHDPVAYQHIKNRIPIQHLQAAIHFYNQFEKERSECLR